MVRAIYVDCFSGASGDMLLGALLDVGVDLDMLQAGLRSLPVSGWTLSVTNVVRQGLRGTHARVHLDQPDQPHRGLADVLRIVHGGTLPEPVTTRAQRVFER